MSLPDIAAGDEEVRRILEDTSISHMVALSRIKDLGYETSKTAVGSWRKKRLVSPYPNSEHEPVTRKRRDDQLPVWSPGITYDNNGGELRTAPRPATVRDSSPPEDAELLEEYGLDPQIWTVTNISRSKWQAGQEWRESFRVSFKRRSSQLGYILTEKEVNDALKVYAKLKPKKEVKQETVLMVPVGDLQLGKGEGGGTEHTIERFGALTQKVYEMVADMGGVDRLILPWLGDCIEGLVSQGGRNVTTLDIPVSEQVRVYRRLMMHQVSMLSPWANHVLIPIVPGNHDETYRLQTQPITDSWAIEGASAVADALELSGKFNNVSWAFPEAEEANVVTDVGGLVVGFTHGHLWRSGQAINWWKNMAHGRQPIGQADIMVSAHLHHLKIEQTGGGRTWLQIPALDGGSAWFRRKSGEDAPAGMMSLFLTPGHGSGWEGLTVHE